VELKIPKLGLLEELKKTVKPSVRIAFGYLNRVPPDRRQMRAPAFSDV
jgi:hypothetical protein